jgi:uncharacterized protein YndB with AHSA1/START domain
MLIAVAVVGIAIIGVLVIAASKPDEFTVQRSRQIAAPAEKIYALIQDFHAWQRWSPYEKKDPDMKREYSGAPSGVGAVYAWDGDKKIGAGRMEIVDAAAPSKVGIRLEFFRPFKGTNAAEFTVQPAGHSTLVTWTMHGKMNFACKLMSTFMDMDKMCGNDFEAGLVAMQSIAEGRESAAEAAIPRLRLQEDMLNVR